MKIHKQLAGSLKKWGRDVSLVGKCGKTVQTEKCFIQALRYKNKMYIEGTPTDIGVNDSGYYLLIGPAALEIGKIEDGGYLSDGEKKYHVDRWEKIYAGPDVFYIWAVLKEHTNGCYPVYNHFR